MKVILSLLIQLSLVPICFSSIPQIELKNGPMKEAIAIYLEKVGIKENEHTVLFLEVVYFEQKRMDSDSLRMEPDVSFTFGIVALGEYAFDVPSPPSFYTFFNNIPVLIYTGYEKMTVYSESEIKDFQKKIIPKRPKVLKSFRPIGFKVINDEIEIFE